jgi:hypothetical protein
MDRLLVVFVDALGPLQRERSRALRELAPFERTLRGVAGFSSGALATVLTGASSAEHGRLCLFSARSKSVPRSPLDALAWLRFVPRIVHERGIVRRRLARWLAEHEKLTGYVALHRVEPSMFRWLDIPEREDLFEAKDIGGVRTFLSEARARGIDVYAARWSLDEATRWRVAFKALRTRPARLTFLYSSELDGVLHAHGPDERSGESVLERVAARIAEARGILSRDGSRVRTVIVGDHGMASVRKTIDPRAVLERAGVRHFVDSTMVRLWGTGAQIELVRLAAERAGWPVRLIDRAGLEAWSVGVDESPWGDAWLVLDEGVLFAPSHVGGFVRGMHGYGPDASSSRAALCSDGAIDPSVTELRSVAGWVRSMMGAWR